MNLQIPVTGVDPGPDFANNVNASLFLVDSHNHSAGQGTAIGPAGLNINADLSFQGNNAINLRSTRFLAQGSPLTGVSDYLSANVSGVDLYFLDGNGNSVRITQSGGVAGSPGSIGNLVSPASATYVSGTPAFVFQSDANTPADIDGGSFIFRNITASSHGVTVAAPSGLAADYSLNWPSGLPGSQVILQLDNTGNLSASNSVPGMVTFGSIALGASGAVLAPVSGSPAIQIPGGLFPGTSANAAVVALNENTLQVFNPTTTDSTNIVTSPAAGTNGLLFVAGAILFTGGINSGEGFTVGILSTGVYEIVFSSAFVDPIRTVASLLSGFLGYLTIDQNNSGADPIVIRTFNTAGTPVAASFTFISVGQRSN